MLEGKIGTEINRGELSKKKKVSEIAVKFFGQNLRVVKVEENC